MLQANSSKKSDCKKLACEIQTCLERNQYQQVKCEKQIEALVMCCKMNNDQVSPFCNGWSFLNNSKVWLFWALEMVFIAILGIVVSV